MSKNIFKIGQEIEMTDDFELKSILGRTTEVKKGDRAYFDSNGFIHYITGNARGMIQPAEAEIKGFDVYNIAKMVYNHISKQYPIDDFLEDEDIEKTDFIEEIESALSDIL